MTILIPPSDDDEYSNHIFINIHDKGDGTGRFSAFPVLPTTCTRCLSLYFVSLFLLS